MMQDLVKNELIDLYFQSKIINVNFEVCLDWAIKELEKNNNNINVAILAGLDKEDESEIKKYINLIFNDQDLEDYRIKENWCCRKLVEIYEMYHKKENTIWDLDQYISSIYQELNYPSWLVMLSRNCEYATDVDNFEKAFEDEFDYIVGLLKGSESMEQFNRIYDRKISNMHDIK